MRPRKPRLEEILSWGRGSWGEGEAAEAKAEDEAAEAKAEDEAVEAEAEVDEHAFYHVLYEDEARPEGEANSSNCCWLGSQFWRRLSYSQTGRA